MIGDLVLAKALEMFNLDVYDPEVSETSENALRCKAIISQFTKACNWGEYEGNHTVEWCAMFAMFCWHKAANLDAKHLAHFSQSTYRLWCWANYLDFNHHTNPKPSSGELRMWVDLRESPNYVVSVLPGDIVIVGDGSPKTGDHVTIAKAVYRNTISTISGNGGGVNSKGKPNNGISAKTFYRDSGLYRPMFVCRPAFGDLLAEAV